MSMRRGPEKNGHAHGASAGNCREACHGALGGSGGRSRSRTSPHIGPPCSKAAVQCLWTNRHQWKIGGHTGDDAALGSCGMAAQSMREEEYRDGEYVDSNETDYLLTDTMRQTSSLMPKSILGNRSAPSGCSMALRAMPSMHGRRRCVMRFPPRILV